LRNKANGSNRRSRVKRERTKSRERLLRATVFDSGHLHHERERPDMERKCMNSDNAQGKEPDLTTFISEVGDGTNKQRKQARVLQCKS